MAGYFYPRSSYCYLSACGLDRVRENGTWKQLGRSESHYHTMYDHYTLSRFRVVCFVGRVNSSIELTSVICDDVLVNVVIVLIDGYGLYYCIGDLQI